MQNFDPWWEGKMNELTNKHTNRQTERTNTLTFTACGYK